MNQRMLSLTLIVSTALILAIGGTITQAAKTSSAVTQNATAITTGWYHTCALTDEGGVRCWGRNDYGQLGDGTTISRITPVDVYELSTGITALTAGGGAPGGPDGGHTCALTYGGGIKCWGANGYGELGDGTSMNRLVPVDVSGLTNGVDITAGDAHTCALTDAGGVKCWGWNGFGQLGDGTTTSRYTPVDVIGLANGVATIAAGREHTCAVTNEGGVKCWGSNMFGQLGDGTTTRRLTPVNVSGLANGVIAVLS